MVKKKITKKSKIILGKSTKPAQKKPRKQKLSKPKTSRKTGEPITKEENREEEKELVQDTISMRKSITESLEYLKEEGAPMALEKYYELKKELDKEKQHFLHKFALDGGLEDAHIAILKSFRTIEKKLWHEYHDALKPIDRSSILGRITELQVYLADAYDANKEIIREQAELKEMLKTEKPSLIV